MADKKYVYNRMVFYTNDSMTLFINAYLHYRKKQIEAGGGFKVGMSDALNELVRHGANRFPEEFKKAIISEYLEWKKLNEKT